MQENTQKGSQEETLHSVLVFDKETGIIVSNSIMSKTAINLNNQYGYLYNQDGSPSTHYVNTNLQQLLERPNQQTKLNGLTLTGLPVPCKIYINDTAYECESDTAELEFDQPTTYTIRVEAWPYQDWETTYENQA